MADDRPGITVLIPTYNRAKVLRETLEALTRVERTGIDCSIVIIDNNCTDNTAEVVKEYQTSAVFRQDNWCNAFKSNNGRGSIFPHESVTAGLPDA